MTFLSPRKALALVLIGGALVRLWGITADFPFLYHRDEPTLVRETLVFPARFGNVGHFDWPHLHYLVNLFFYAPRILYDVSRGVDFSLDQSLLPYLLISRVLSVSLSLGTIGLIYLFASQLTRSTSVGLLSALFLAFNLHHAQFGHDATLDTALVFWMSLAWLALLKLYREGGRRWYVLSGALIGLSISTKYNGGFLLVPLVLAHLGRVLHVQVPHTFRQMSISIRSLGTLFLQGREIVIAFSMVILGFLLGTPYALFDARTFLSTDGPKGALWQFVHVGNSGLSQGILERYVSQIHAVVYSNTGLVGLLLLCIGIRVLWRSSREGRWLILPFIVGYLGYVGTFSLAPVHYFLPLQPLLSICCAVGLWYVLPRVLSFFAIPPRNALRTMLLLVVFSLAQPVLSTVWSAYVHGQTDTRTLAREWMEANLPVGSGVVLGNDYEPLLDENRFALYSLHALLNNENLSRPIYPKLNDRGIRYGVLGDYDLAERFETASWDPGDPDFPSYLMERAKLIARFDPIHRPGPTVMVFEIAAEYELNR